MEKQCVLVVDDREIVNAIAINLDKEGFEAIRAYDGLQALDVLNSNGAPHHHDVMMPRMDGSPPLKIRSRRTSPS